MFTDIERAFSSYHFRMFDYYDIQPSGDQYVTPLDEQAKRLQHEIDSVADGDVVLLCHSQGSTIAGLVDVARVSKIILLAPPVDITADSVLARLAQRQGSKLRRDAMSVVPRSDGTHMYIPSEYFDSLERDDRMELYQKLARQCPLVIVRALDDETLGMTRVDEIKDARLYDIAADHNFRGDARKLLIATLAKEL